MQSDFNNDLRQQKSRTESILEDSDNEKATVQQKLDAMEENILEKLEVSNLHRCCVCYSFIRMLDGAETKPDKSEFGTVRA